MSWDKVCIKDVSLGIYDGPHATPPPSDSGAIFLGISNFVNGQLDLSDIRYIAEEDLPRWTKRVIPQKNDIVFSYEATLNLYAIIPKGFRGCLGRRMALIRPDTSKINYKFLYYYFYSKAWRDVISENIVLGATVDRIPLVKFPNFQIELPSMSIQNKIADQLSAYDDLIENNQKQIKLLEEAAQRLYKEWFVDLHFPGHETTPIVDGIPQGWKYEDIDDIYSIKYGKNLPTTEINSLGEYPVYGANGVIGYYDKYNCDSFVTLITSRGNGSGDVSRTHHMKSFVTNNSFMVFPKESYDYVGNEFTYLLMKNTDYKSVCTGSAQPQLTNNSISTLKLLFPSQQIVISFCNNVHGIFGKIEMLLKQNQLLSEARDRLLPKLMSREIEV